MEITKYMANIYIYIYVVFILLNYEIVLIIFGSDTYKCAEVSWLAIREISHPCMID